MSAPAPDDRYPPIGDYGLVGDLRSAALISKQGSVDWLCLPRFDSPWVFGRLLDWDRGGCFVIAPAGEATSFRQYSKGSNVLETTWSIERCRMRVVDFMPIMARGIRAVLLYAPQDNRRPLSADAGALAVPLVGMVPANDPRVISTIAVLARRLTNRGFLYRYVPEESEFHQPEGVFIICTCWMVDVLARMGRLREAEELFTRVTEAANDLGLFAEEFDPEQRIMLGNFPQALTHLAVIGAVLSLEGRTVGRGTLPRAGAGQPSN